MGRFTVMADNDFQNAYPESKVDGSNMGPTWVLSAPSGPHVDLMKLTIRVCSHISVGTCIRAFNKLRPRQKGQHFAEYISKKNFCNGNVCLNFD